MNKLIVPHPGEDLLDLGKRCDAVYICPKVGSTRKGPLVVYAGKDKLNRNLVGDIYFNFRKIESHPKAVEAFAEAIYQKLCYDGTINSFDAVCGIPNGGRTLAQALALIAKKRFTYADKKPRPTEVGKKQEYDWDLSQFEFESGERVAIVEDVYNNFQNTDNTLSAIDATGANIIMLIGALNRSPHYGKSYTPKSGTYEGIKIPIVASIREPFPEYEQDSPSVVKDIASGNVEFEVKKNWAQLRNIMEQFKS